VRNPVGGQPTTPGGSHGLIGTRERVDTVHGALTTGVGSDGTFTVHAEIPRRSS
jgi:signal transduction histidine kinase